MFVHGHKLPIATASDAPQLSSPCTPEIEESAITEIRRESTKISETLMPFSIPESVQSINVQAQEKWKTVTSSRVAKTDLRNRARAAAQSIQ